MWWWMACTTPTDTAGDSDVPPMEHAFSFVVFADPHISSDIEHEERLAAAVQWVNDNAAAEQIELVWIVGDIGWGPGLETANALLSDLTVPWVPVLGDNEVHLGSEADFNDVFAAQWAELEATFPGMERGPVEVHNTTYDTTSWMVNLVFEHRGLRWVGLDWNSRNESGLLGEFGELNDFEGGTLPFFQDHVGTLEASDAEDVLLFSHHPMHVGVFNDAQMAELTAVTGPIRGRVAGAYAGHLHLTATIEVDEGGYTAWVTDAIWDDENTIRVVEVHTNGLTHTYVQDLVVIP